MVPKVFRFQHYVNTKRVVSDVEEDIKQLVVSLLQLYAEESFTEAASEAVLHGKPVLDLL